MYLIGERFDWWTVRLVNGSIGERHRTVLDAGYSTLDCGCWVWWVLVVVYIVVDTLLYLHLSCYSFNFTLLILPFFFYPFFYPLKLPLNCLILPFYSYKWHFYF